MIRQTLFLLALSLCPVLADRLPPDALELKGKRDAKVAEIDRAYAAALDKLQKKAMESGNLSAANEIQKEMARVVSDPFRDDSKTAPQTVSSASEDQRLTPLIGTWKRDTDNGVWVISNTKGGVFNGNLPFTMTFDEKNNRVAVVGSHWADHLTLTSNPDVVHGSTMIDGRTVRYKLKRIK